jgi:hypothetical protein
MFKNFLLVIAVLIFANVFILPGFTHEPDYEITIAQVTSPPKIDGRLDDSVWQIAEPVEWGNINNGGEVDEDQFSYSWAVYDSEFIYIAFRNMEPNTNALTLAAAGHDQSVWSDDENEIFIEPNHMGTTPYFHIMVNADNVTGDSESGGAEDGWEPDMESETQIYNDNWVLELKIPFKDLGFDEVPIDETWGWNFNRHIVTGVDIWTSWATTGASFHTPERFGNLTFGLEQIAVQPSGKLTATWGRIKSIQ